MVRGGWHGLDDASRGSFRDRGALRSGGIFRRGPRQRRSLVEAPEPSRSRRGHRSGTSADQPRYPRWRSHCPRRLEAPGHAWCYGQRPAPACQRGGPRVQVGPDGGPCPHVLPARTGAWGTSRSNAQTTDDPERSLGHRAGYSHPLRPARVNRKAVVRSCGKLLCRPPQCAASRRPAAVGDDLQPRGVRIPSACPEGRGTSFAT